MCVDSHTNHKPDVPAKTISTLNTLLPKNSFITAYKTSQLVIAINTQTVVLFIYFWWYLPFFKVKFSRCVSLTVDSFCFKHKHKSEE